MNKILINKSGFSGRVWIDSEFSICDLPYKVRGYAGFWNKENNEFSKLVAEAREGLHSEVIKLLPKIDISFVLPTWDKKDFDLLFHTKEEAIFYWLSHLRDKEIPTIIQYPGEIFYRIEHEKSDIIPSWEWDYDFFLGTISRNSKLITPILLENIDEFGF
jgi:hypothetical protein